MTERQLRQRLARNLKAIRTGVGLSIEEAAGRSEVDPRHWRKIEDGDVSATLRTLANIATGLGIDPADLLAAPPASPP